MSTYYSPVLRKVWISSAPQSVEAVCLSADLSKSQSYLLWEYSGLHADSIILD